MFCLDKLLLKKKCRCSGNLWIAGVVNQRKAKGPRNWCRLFIRHKHFSRLGKLFHTGSNNTTLVTSPNNGNRPTWATGIVITIHKSKWVSFFESISQFFGRCINYTEKWWVVEVLPWTSCVNVIICIDSFWSLCAESVNGGTDVVIKGQWTMTTGILIGGISGGETPVNRSRLILVKGKPDLLQAKIKWNWVFFSLTRRCIMVGFF